MKQINSVDSSLSLQRCADSLFSERNHLSSSIVVQLLKKAGDLQITTMLGPLFLRYYQNAGYSEVVTNELIDQYCRYYNLEAIAELYAKLKRDSILFSKTTYERFLLSLLRSIQYEQICLNITKEMLNQGYVISSEALFKALSLPCLCDSEIFISILSITNARELPVRKIAPMLGNRLISFSKANREISVYETFRYLSIISPHSNKEKFIPYLTKCYRYFFERHLYRNSLSHRNLSIEYNNKDSAVMTAITQALLQTRFEASNSIASFVDFIQNSPQFQDVKLSVFFLHVWYFSLLSHSTRKKKY